MLVQSRFSKCIEAELKFQTEQMKRFKYLVLEKKSLKTKRENFEVSQNKKMTPIEQTFDLKA